MKFKKINKYNMVRVENYLPPLVSEDVYVVQAL